MKKLIFTLLLLIPNLIWGNELADCNIKDKLIHENISKGNVNIYKISQNDKSCLEEDRRNFFVEISDSSYWFIHFYDEKFFNDWEGDVQKINEKLLLIKEGTPWTTKNTFLNIQTEELLNIPNGLIEIKDEQIIAKGIKSYFPEKGGAFWYSGVFNLNGELIKFQKYEGATCEPISNFAEFKIYKDEIVKNDIKELCHWHELLGPPLGKLLN